MTNKRKKAMSSSDDDDDYPKLPQAVVDEILKRLPVKSLLRFRCVSRSWRSAIDDPRFAALHLSHSALHTSNWYFAFIDDPRHHCPRTCSLFPIDSRIRPSKLIVETPFVDTPPSELTLVGWCNGLICVADEPYGKGYMYLWNLFTRKQKVVPLSRPEQQQFLSKDAVDVVLGFGFDAGSNDHKILRILYFPDNDRRWFGRVEIYSLRADSWRSLECEVPAFRPHNKAVFLNGNLHWVAAKLDDLGRESKDGSRIFLFNVAGEVFDEMAMPEEIETSDEDDFVLLVSVAVLNDSLAVFVCRSYPFGPAIYSACSVWVMRDYGVPQSWTKLYDFETGHVVIAFFGFTWNGEPSIREDNGDTISWNPITGRVRNLFLDSGSEFVTVVENLVSL
ncbi:hypothetical protein BT93_D0772 [Corymbia citriodora subsp. variegata]|nr:hypothetical protein BT93_D0772 [Corymbia citriodora subsp. variegata]